MLLFKLTKEKRDLLKAQSNEETDEAEKLAMCIAGAEMMVTREELKEVRDRLYTYGTRLFKILSVLYHFS